MVKYNEMLKFTKKKVRKREKRIYKKKGITILQIIRRYIRNK